MALVSSVLQSQLETAWLVPPGGSYPESVQVSGDRFASAVASWFSLAQANGIPCDTATDRQAQLASLVTSAFSAVPTATADSAAQGLAKALTDYITGQQFGDGVAAPPAGGAAAASAFSAVLSDLELPNTARAQLLANACQDLARSTFVTFPPSTSLPPAPLE